MEDVDEAVDLKCIHYKIINLETEDYLKGKDVNGESCN